MKSVADLRAEMLAATTDAERFRVRVEVMALAVFYAERDLARYLERHPESPRAARSTPELHATCLA